MAQHDYVIDNSTGANVRADINSALLAISSNNSGSSAPSTTYALQSFANTTNSKLQLRNAANNAFVNLRGFDGSLPLPDGSESSPSLFFDDDTNTGIYSSAADTLNITTAGSTKMTIDSSGRVGIGTTTPEEIVHIKGPTETISSRDGVMLQNSTESHAANNGLPLVWSGYISASNTNYGLASICGRKENSIDNNAAAYLEFGTSNSAGSISSKMIIDSSGNVGIGTTSPTSTGIQSGIKTVQIDSGDGAELILGNSQSSSVAANHIGAIAFKNIDTSTGTAPHYAGIRCNATDNSGNMNLKFYAGSTKFETDSPHMLIDSSGNVGIGTASPTATVHCSSTVKTARFEMMSTGDVIGIHMRHQRGALSGFNGKIISFEGNGAVETGSITIHQNSTVYGTTSDYRLKDNIENITDGIERLKKLTPRKFNFKTSPSVRVDGFIAHEVAEANVVAECVSGEKDAMQALTFYEDGDTMPSGKVIGDAKTFSDTEISPQSIDVSKLVPLLVAAVQELIGKVEALEAA